MTINKTVPQPFNGLEYYKDYTPQNVREIVDFIFDETSDIACQNISMKVLHMTLNYSLMAIRKDIIPL